MTVYGRSSSVGIPAHLVLNRLISLHNQNTPLVYHGLGEYLILIGCRVSINPWYMDAY